MDKSIPYELTGRTRQKSRTRNALVAAARQLLAEGVTPTVEQAADRAEVSRTTAYRYFPNQRALLLATYPQLEASSQLGAAAPSDPLARLDLVVEAITDQVVEHEPALRAQLRLSLESPPPGPEALPFRRGRAIAWLEDALAPLQGRVPKAELRRLVLAIRATIGIEALVWLTDVAGLSRPEAVEIMRSSARTLARAVIAETAPDGPPMDPPS
ncbi:MAG TPA: TetR/AcrR family transcriptional regulator [Candidatus Dormibacteraeota bacterium]|nr:TetR/AcrR family transcriptional regulator [Candidatus Dormibacteraeota bacterium]